MLCKPDCCNDPQLLPLKALDQSPDGELVLMRCACSAYWRAQTQTRMAMNGGEDRTLESFSSFTDEEGWQILFGAK